MRAVNNLRLNQYNKIRLNKVPIPPVNRAAHIKVRPVGILFKIPPRRNTDKIKKAKGTTTSPVNIKVKISGAKVACGRKMCLISGRRAYQLDE